MHHQPQHHHHHHHQQHRRWALTRRAVRELCQFPGLLGPRPQVPRSRGPRAPVPPVASHRPCHSQVRSTFPGPFRPGPFRRSTPILRPSKLTFRAAPPLSRALFAATALR